MLKKHIKTAIVILIVSVTLCGCGQTYNNTEVKDAMSDVNNEYMKAMWLSQYDMKDVYTDGGKQREKGDFSERVDRILDNMVSIGINTVIVQVRPFADSMYPSELYPMSSFVVGEYGKDADYDPFSVILDKAHERGMELHAWINPMRAMTDEEIKLVPRGFLVREWYESEHTRGKYIVRVDGRWYLDPAYAEVRSLIAEGAAEIAALYDVDGVHMDDYFYPTTDESFDCEAYAEYKAAGGECELAQFRRDNVSRMVKEIYSAVKTAKSDVTFGISPAGVMKNNYNKLFADVERWCSEKGYLDYICPQIYFGFEHDTCAFDKLCCEFSDMVKAEGVRLIIGMTLGKAYSEYDRYAGSGAYEWRDNKDVLLRELEYSLAMEKCSGVCYFSYQYFFDPMTNEAVERTSAEREKLLPLLKTAKTEGDV